MKIVILEKEEALGIGGIVVQNKRLTNYLRKKGHEVTIIRFTNIKDHDNGVIRIPYRVAEKRTFIFVPSEKTKQLLTRHLRRLKPDVVHFCLGISTFDFFIPSLCHQLKIPIVGIWHGDINNASDTYSLLVKSIYLAYTPICRELDGLIVFSQKLKDFYSQRGMKTNRFKIIPNGVNNKTYSPGLSKFKKVNNIKTGVLFLGRLTFVKHPDILIESFLKLDPTNDTKLVIVGTGEMENELKKNFSCDRVIFTGLVGDEKQKVDIIRSCDIFVLPSSYEGMSLALLESMSCGLACIATDAGDSAELLNDKGIVISHQKIKQELFVALRILLEQEQFRKKLGQRARDLTKKFYSEDNIFSNYVSFYKNVISDYQFRGCPKTSALGLNLTIAKRVKTLWRKAKDLGANYLLGEGV